MNIFKRLCCRDEKSKPLSYEGSPFIVIGRLIRKQPFQKKLTFGSFFISLLPFILVYLFLMLIGTFIDYMMTKYKLFRTPKAKELINKKIEKANDWFNQNY